MRTIETNELERMHEQNEDVIVINVLDTKSFAREHVPGSHNVPYTDPDLVGHIERLAGRKDRRIVVHCSNPNCPASPEAGGKLERAGFTNVMHYAGGMDAWKAAGFEIESGEDARAA